MSRTISVLLGFIVLFILIAIVSGVGREISEEVGRAISTSVSPSPEQISDTLAESLAVAAQELNDAGPVLIDASTRTDRESAGPGARITYHHTIVGHSSLEIDREWFHSAMADTVRSNVYTSPEMALALQHGATFADAYVGDDQVPITSSEVRQEDCG